MRIKRQVVLPAVLCLFLSGISGCGIFSNEEQNTTIIAEQETKNDGQTAGNEQDTGEEEPTEEPTTEAPTIGRVTFDGDINAISNEKITWGVGVQKLEDGRPVAPVQLQEQYGDKYAVEFIKENEKVIYLTFDEGYENGYTGQILDTLKEKNVKAVFFITMDYAKREPELIRRMIDEGHVVGSHSVTHPSQGMQSLPIDQQIQEYEELENYVLEQYDYEMWLFRPPTGAFSEQSLAVAQSCGYRSIMWSFAYADWDPDNQQDVPSALDNAVGKLHNGAIYLLHAVSKTNAEMLGDFIDQAQAAGYVFKEYK